MTTRSTRQRESGARRRSAFTLIELLIVIGILAILVALVATAGTALISSRKATLTRDVLTSLDRMLEEFMIDNAGAAPIYRPADYARVPGDDLFAANNAPDNWNAPSVDTTSGEVLTITEAFAEYGGRIHSKFPDAAVFLRQVRGYGQVDAILGNIGDRWLLTTIDGDAPSGDIAADTTPSVIDVWATGAWNDLPTTVSYPILREQVIYYVHPQNTLAQALYGACVNRRPYFMSAGPDGLYGVTNQFTDDGRRTGSLSGPLRDTPLYRALRALEDNIYSYAVEPARGVVDFTLTDAELQTAIENAAGGFNTAHR